MNIALLTCVPSRDKKKIEDQNLKLNTVYYQYIAEVI